MIVFGCLVWVHAHYLKRIQVASDARACAWLWAQAACEGEVPPGCTIEPGGAVPTDDFTTMIGPDGAAALTDLRSHVSFLAPVLDAVFGRSATSTQEAVVRRPDILGGGERRVGSRAALLCDERPRNMPDVVWDIFHELTGW